MSAATSTIDHEIVKAPAIAKLYDTTPPTIYRWAKEGKIPCIAFEGIIRFNVAAVRAAIEGKGGVR
jgi:predicted site-specific integrase-resolvase